MVAQARVAPFEPLCFQESTSATVRLHYWPRVCKGWIQRLDLGDSSIVVGPKIRAHGQAQQQVPDYFFRQLLCPSVPVNSRQSTKNELP